jgi:hypothetical protein
MSMFDERKNALEAKYAHDQEQMFKFIAKRNYRLGLWAAGLLGRVDEEAKAYAHEVIKSDFEEPGEEDVVRKVTADLQPTGKTEEDVRAEMGSLLVEIMAEASTETS